MVFIEESLEQLPSQREVRAGCGLRAADAVAVGEIDGDFGGRASRDLAARLHVARKAAERESAKEKLDSRIERQSRKRTALRPALQKNRGGERGE
jgi:hypothetical protein